MNFTFNEDDIAFQDAAHRVCADVLKTHAARYDETREFCQESLRALGELGFWSMNLPSEYGGVDISSIGMSLAVEEIAYHCAATWLVADGALSRHRLGTDRCHRGTAAGAAAAVRKR